MINQQKRLFGLRREDIEDDRWGDWVCQHGPFIVTNKGIFTDFFKMSNAAEMFFYYCPWEYTPSIIVRREEGDNGAPRTHAPRVKTNMVPLFLGEEVHPELPLFRCSDYKKYEKQFRVAVDVAWEFAKRYK